MAYGVRQLLSNVGECDLMYYIVLLNVFCMWLDLST